MIHPEPPFLHRWDRDRYPESYLRRHVPEESVQSAILGLLAARKVFAWPVDSGAKTIRGRAYGALKGGGLPTTSLIGRTGAAPKGVCDIIGVQRETGRAVLIEVKRPEWLGRSAKTGKLIQFQPPGTPTIEQLEFLQMGFAFGALVGVAWSIEDADLILNAEIQGDS